MALSILVVMKQQGGWG